MKFLPEQYIWAMYKEESWGNLVFGRLAEAIPSRANQRTKSQKDDLDVAF